MRPLRAGPNPIWLVSLWERKSGHTKRHQVTCLFLRTEKRSCEDTVRRETPTSQAERNKTCQHLTLDFQPPELWERNFGCLSLWCFVRAVLADGWGSRQMGALPPPRGDGDRLQELHVSSLGAQEVRFWGLKRRGCEEVAVAHKRGDARTSRAGSQDSHNQAPLFLMRALSALLAIPTEFFCWSNSSLHQVRVAFASTTVRGYPTFKVLWNSLTICVPRWSLLSQPSSALSSKTWYDYPVR